MQTTTTLTAVISGTSVDWPLMITLAASVAVGLGMVVVFGFTSNQKAIKRSKDQIQANLLAVRLFQDQLGAVLRSYVGIITSLGCYLRLSFTPLLIVILPLTVFIIQMDRFLGWTPLPAGQSFLVKARVANADALNEITLRGSSGEEISADVVHMPGSNEVIWRIPALDSGSQTLKVSVGGRTVAKSIVIGEGSYPRRLSLIRLQGSVWKRLLDSGESPIEVDAAVQSIQVIYPTRKISLFGFRMNWIVWFFVFSMIAGYIFKSLLGIQI